MAARHLSLGERGETAAAEHLRRAGFKILDRNWSEKGFELDLVCRYKKTIVFVEVKTRGPGSLGRPSDGLTTAKQRKLVKAANLWLTRHDAWDAPCRFDFVAVTDDGNNLHLEHIPDAFDLGQALGGGNAPWQPW